MKIAVVGYAVIYYYLASLYLHNFTFQLPTCIVAFRLRYAYVASLSIASFIKLMIFGAQMICCSTVRIT